MILHLVNRQLKQREQTEFERFGIEDNGISYDTHNEDESQIVPNRERLARSHSPTKPPRQRISSLVPTPQLRGFQEEAVRDDTLNGLRIQHTSSFGRKPRQAQVADNSRNKSRLDRDGSASTSRIAKKKHLIRPQATESMSQFSSSINAREESVRETKKPAKRQLKKQISRSPLISKNSSMISMKSKIKSVKLVSKLKTSEDKQQPTSGSIPTTIKGSIQKQQS